MTLHAKNVLSLTNTHLRESMKRGVYVDGLSEHIVTSAREAYQVIHSMSIKVHILLLLEIYGRLAGMYLLLGCCSEL